MPRRIRMSNSNPNVNPNFNSKRILATPSTFAREHYLYVQETGSLQSIEPHISRRTNLNSYLLFIVTKGSGHLFYKGTKHRIVAGDCIYLHCKHEYAHESSLEDPWELSWVHFYGKESDAFYQAYEEQGFPFLFHPQTFAEFERLLHTLYNLHLSQNTIKEILSHQTITDLIALCFSSQLQQKLLEKESPTPSSTKMEEIRQYIDSNFSKKLTLEFLSDQYFISKYHLSREFRKQIGISFSNYLQQKRISHAKNLLRFSSHSIEEISLLCGFMDAGYFIKAFRSSEHLTPKQYRKTW